MCKWLSHTIVTKSTQKEILLRGILKFSLSSIRVWNSIIYWELGMELSYSSIVPCSLFNNFDILLSICSFFCFYIIFWVYLYVTDYEGFVSSRQFSFFDLWQTPWLNNLAICLSSNFAHRAREARAKILCLVRISC